MMPGPFLTHVHKIYSHACGFDDNLYYLLTNSHRCTSKNKQVYMISLIHRVHVGGRKRLYTFKPTK